MEVEGGVTVEALLVQPANGTIVPALFTKKLLLFNVNVPTGGHIYCRLPPLPVTAVGVPETHVPTAEPHDGPATGAGVVTVTGVVAVGIF